MYNVDWFVKDTTTNAELVIINKRYEVDKGWIYSVKFDDPIIVDPTLEIEEKKLEPVFTISTNGYKVFKSIK